MKLASMVHRKKKKTEAGRSIHCEATWLRRSSICDAHHTRDWQALRYVSVKRLHFHMGQAWGHCEIAKPKDVDSILGAMIKNG